MQQETVLMVLPEIDKHTESVEISYWLKKDGDFVQKEEPICEVETEEFEFALEATDTGILKIIAKNGTNVKIGDTICEILVDKE
jgi:2-oxoglutarate dehydrogenase E2 component (dihydrolipoamide succinyltransferase)